MTWTDLTTFVTYNPVSVGADAGLDEVLGLLNQVDFHHLPVVDEERRLLGLLTTGDVAEAVQQRLAVVTALAAGDAPEADVLGECSAADAMTRRVVSIRAGQTPTAALRRLLDKGLSALPLLDDDRLVGITTRTDFLREFSYAQSEPSRERALEAAEAVAHAIDADASLEEADAALRAAEGDYVGVVRGDFPLGVISHRDVRSAQCRQAERQWSRREGPLEGPATVLELVAAAPTIRPGERLAEAAARMFEARRQVVSVVNQAHRLLGVVSEANILRRMLDDLVQ